MSGPHLISIIEFGRPRGLKSYMGYMQDEAVPDLQREAHGMKRLLLILFQQYICRHIFHKL